MVLNITVKTLDSQNYQFEANDDWTVLQFKEHIQSTVNVSSNEQRLIFCGRVLQDDKKLVEYDCNGKVIHLVRRPPPPLDNPSQSTPGADSNNNSDNFRDGSNDNARFLDESNVLFSAMTLGPDANMNHVLRHILTLQQAIYTRTVGDGTPVATTIEPMSMTNIDRHLHNAARLLRITVSTINECMTRIAALPPTGARPTTEGVISGAPRPVIAAASSQTDLQRDEEMQANLEGPPPTGAPESSTDDITVGLSAEIPARRSRPSSRQSLTTDDIPQSTARPIQRLVNVPVVSPRNENRSNLLSLRQRGESELDRYLSILNCSCDLQNQFQGLARRYRQLTDMSRRGGLIVPQACAPVSTNSSSNLEEQNQTQSSSNQSGQVSSGLVSEARILGLFIPRIMHHISHLQHALSDFSVDFNRGRLMLCAGPNTTRVPPRMARRSNNSSQDSSGVQTSQPANDQPAPAQPDQLSSQINLSRDASHTSPTLEGSVTITATTVEATPLATAASTSGMRPQANATILVTSEQGQAGIHIPVSIPLTLNSHGPINMDFGLNQSQYPRQEQGERADSSTRQTAQQPRPAQQATTSNSTQTASRPIGLISGRIPLPFDYYLPCFSPWANYSVTNRPGIARPEENHGGTSVRVRFNSRPRDTSRQTGNLNADNRPSGPTTTNETQPSRDSPASPVMDMGLNEVVSNIFGSILSPILRTAQRAPEAPQEPASNSPNQDPFLNMIPELALNAASQILGGVLGLPTGNQQTGILSTGQPPTSRPQQTSRTVMMDIDIDDSSSSQSESRYQDARESNSPTSAASHVQSSQRNLSSEPPITTQSNFPQTSASSNSDQRNERQRLVEVMRNHSEWIPIIEADIGVMERQQGQSNQAFFSDAYLSSIPRKRRRLLTASPERVLILQPSSSQAITNLLRRAIENSCSSNIESLEQVLSDISGDATLQSAYEDYIKTAVEARLRTDYDYCPEKFENSSKYFK